MAGTKSLKLFDVLGLLFCLCLVVSAQDDVCKNKSDLCSCELNDGSGVINLGLVGYTNGSSRFSANHKSAVGTETLELTYMYNPCYGLLDLPECHGSSLCLKVPVEIEDTLLDLYTTYGTNTSTTWINDTETQAPAIVYTNGNVNFTVVLICCQNNSNSTFIVDEKRYNRARLESQDVCPGKVQPTTPAPTSTPVPEPSEPKKSGLSTGSIIIILFFVFLILYLVGGMIYKKIVNGAQGKELIPNVEFWTSLPGLVLDGCAFICNCCGKRKGSTPGYDGV